MKKHVVDFFKFLKRTESVDVDLKTKLLNPNVFVLSKDDLDYKGNLYLAYTDISSLPDGLKVGGDLDLGDTNITELPDELEFNGYLGLSYTQISSLPDGLYVNGYLGLSYTQISSLPDGLKVNDYLDLRGTPIAKKYSVAEIRAMIENNGGYVSGNIYL